MRNTMKTMIMFFFILSVALSAQAAKNINKIATLSCGYLGGPDVDLTAGVTFKSALQVASKQCWRLGNREAANKYAAQARNCGKADKDKCSDHFKELKQTWCGYNPGVQLSSDKLSDVNFLERADKVREAEYKCSDQNYTDEERTAANVYFNTRSTVNGVVTLPSMACFNNKEHNESLCLDTYNALFKVNSPY